MSPSAADNEGEAPQAAAYQLGPLPRAGGIGPAVQAVALLMGVQSVVVVALRVWVGAGYSGASPTRLWGAEDYLALLGTLAFAFAAGFAVRAAAFGVGSHDADFPPFPSGALYQVRAAEYEVYWELL